LIGTRVDKYDLIEKIGEGGMASVYLAQHHTLQREVAVKVLHPHLSNAMKSRQRFAREARTIERLEHPNILRIYDYSGEEAEHCYIVTELIRGQTLKELVGRAGLFPSELVAIIGIHIGQGLAYAHDQGVIHRDIKPENVMVHEDGTLKLMDFGIARLVEESAITMTGSLIGSPAYMSPEQVLERTPDLRSDLFSFGAMLFNLVTGQLAFPGTNPSVILKKVIEGDHPRILDLQPTAHPDLAELIERLLCPSPDGRPANAHEVVKALEAVLTDSKVHASDASWSLPRYLDESAQYTEELHAHLEAHLLTAGREALQNGAHHDAKNKFNRLLALRPDHPQVIDLLSDIALAGTIRAPNESIVRWIGLALLAIMVPSIWFWSIGSSQKTKELKDKETPEEASLVSPIETDAGAIPLPTPPDAPDVTTAPAKTALKQSTSPKQPQNTTRIDNTKTKNNPKIASPDQTPVVDADSSTDKESLNEGGEDNTKPPKATLGQVRVSLSKTQETWADIYIDGRRKGRIRGTSPKEYNLKPGSHTLKVANDYAIPIVHQIEVTAGEVLAFENIELQKRPISVRIRPDIPVDCTVTVNGRARGPISKTSRVISIGRPKDIKTLEIQCPEDGSRYGPYADQAIPTPGSAVAFPPQ